MQQDATKYQEFNTYPTSSFRLLFFPAAPDLTLVSLIIFSGMYLSLAHGIFKKEQISS
jgi:hypothetical protein